MVRSFTGPVSIHCTPCLALYSFLWQRAHFMKQKHIYKPFTQTGINDPEWYGSCRVVLFSFLSTFKFPLTLHPVSPEVCDFRGSGSRCKHSLCTHPCTLYKLVNNFNPRHTQHVWPSVTVVSNKMCSP